MVRKVVALCLTFALALPAGAAAGPLKEAAANAGPELARAQTEETRSRSRFWTGIALIAGGGALAALGSFELGDDEAGPDDGEDFDESDDGEDSDTNKALIGSGIAAAAVGTVLLLTGRKDAGTRVSVRPDKVTVRHTIRF